MGCLLLLRGAKLKCLQAPNRVAGFVRLIDGGEQ